METNNYDLESCSTRGCYWVPQQVALGLTGFKLRNPFKLMWELSLIIVSIHCHLSIVIMIYLYFHCVMLNF